MSRGMKARRISVLLRPHSGRADSPSRARIQTRSKENCETATAWASTSVALACENTERSGRTKSVNSCAEQTEFLHAHITISSFVFDPGRAFGTDGAADRFC